MKRSFCPQRDGHVPMGTAAALPGSSFSLSCGCSSVGRGNGMLLIKLVSSWEHVASEPGFPPGPQWVRPRVLSQERAVWDQGSQVAGRWAWQLRGTGVAQPASIWVFAGCGTSTSFSSRFPVIGVNERP